MNKTKRDLSLVTPLAISIISFLIGCALIIFDKVFNEDMCLYLAIMFYIMAFTSCLVYFIGRKKGDYDYLLFTLINVIAATLLFVFQNMNNIILGTSIVVFTVLFIFNRILKIVLLKKNDSFMWGVKSYGLFLVILLGALTSFNLYREVTYAPLMLGYFFITFSIITSVESFIEIFITENKFKRIMMKFFQGNEKLEETKEEVKKEEKVENIKAFAKKGQKKTAEKKETVKKTTSKKTVSKKAPTKKTPAKKTTVKKSSPKKATVKKEVSKKATTKTVKTPVKKKTSKKA